MTAGDGQEQPPTIDAVAFLGWSKWRDASGAGIAPEAVEASWGRWFRDGGPVPQFSAADDGPRRRVSVEAGKRRLAMRERLGHGYAVMLSDWVVVVARPTRLMPYRVIPVRRRDGRRLLFDDAAIAGIATALDVGIDSSPEAWSSRIPVGELLTVLCDVAIATGQPGGQLWLAAGTERRAFATKPSMGFDRLGMISSRPRTPIRETDPMARAAAFVFDVGRPMGGKCSRTQDGPGRIGRWAFHPTVHWARFEAPDSAILRVGHRDRARRDVRNWLTMRGAPGDVIASVCEDGPRAASRMGVW